MVLIPLFMSSLASALPPLKLDERQKSNALVISPVTILLSGAFCSNIYYGRGPRLVSAFSLIATAASSALFINKTNSKKIKRSTA